MYASIRLRAFPVKLVGQALAHPLGVAEHQRLPAGASTGEPSLRDQKAALRCLRMLNRILSIWSMTNYGHIIYYLYSISIYNYNDVSCTFQVLVHTVCVHVTYSLILPTTKKTI